MWGTVFTVRTLYTKICNSPCEGGVFFSFHKRGKQDLDQLNDLPKVIHPERGQS